MNKNINEILSMYRKSYMFLYVIIQQEVINFTPHEPSENCIVSNKRGRQLIISDVYNHLYEGEAREESDNYDHACAATFDMRDSNLQRNDHIPISSDEMKVDTDNYSIIKL